jgi:hypothetical protein
MKTSLVLIPLWVAVMGAFMNFSAPVFGDNNAISALNQATDLVHQAWNPGGDPSGNVQRTDLLKQALKLAQQAHPAKQFGGHLSKAVKAIQAALALIKSGASPDKVYDPLHDAETELRNALAYAQSIGASEPGEPPLNLPG